MPDERRRGVFSPNGVRGVDDEALDRTLRQLLRDSQQIDRRPRFEHAVCLMAHRFPGCRFIGVSASGMVVWPGLGRFFTEVRLDGAGSAWLDSDCKYWVWQPPSSS